jgi:tetratricopeptide (TPR) repeat protein
VIRDQLVAAIDHWAFVALMQNDGPSVERLLRIARLADPEPRWGDRFRDRAVWQSADQMRELADAAFTTSPPPPGYQLALLGLLLRERRAGQRHTLLLAEACRRQRSNYWLSREMAAALSAEHRLHEAAGYYRAALAVRPQSAWTHNDLGLVMLMAGQTDEGLAECRRAVELAPASRTLRAHLVNELAEAGYWKEAATECRRALEFDPSNYLPAILAGKERPTDVPTLHALAEWCLKHKRLTATAADFYTAVLSAQPSLADDLEAGQRFQAACAAALAGCGIGADAGRLDERRRAGLRKQALEWLTAEYDAWAQRHRRGKPGDYTVAATAVRAWQRNDDLAAVRDEKALAKLPLDERRPSWPSGSELSVAGPRLPAVGQARRGAAMAGEGDLLVGPTGGPDARRKPVHGIAPPQLARSARTAPAGRGTASIGAVLQEGQKSTGSVVARQWLRAELAAQTRALEADPTAARWGVCEALTRWRKEPDLTCVRDPGELNKLAADERKEYLALWAEVAAVLARTDK